MKCREKILVGAAIAVAIIGLAGKEIYLTHLNKQSVYRELSKKELRQMVEKDALTGQSVFSQMVVDAQIDEE